MKNAKSPSNRSSRNFSALVAVGGSLAAFPAAALELGDISVHSRLGQPLRASIAYALAPNEQVSDRCITINNGLPVDGLPGIGQATVRLGNGVISLTGKTPVREPIIGAQVTINCPYAPNLSRAYMLFVDPADLTRENATVAQQVVPVAASAAIRAPAASTPTVARTAKPVQKDLRPSSRYQVRPGDSAGEIAGRIENRGVGLWAAVDAIFAANPDAFLNNDPNQLKAGSWLTIPSFNGEPAVVSPVKEIVSVESAPVVTVDAETVEVAAPAEVAAPIEAAAQIAIESSVTMPVAEIADSTGDLQPGDIIIPDTQLEGPVTRSTSPNVPTAIISPRPQNSDTGFSGGWMVWLAGSGLAIILGLLFFGRRLRGASGDTPVQPEAATAPQRRASDTGEHKAVQTEDQSIDFDLTDDSPTQENLALDADLIIGTGLAESSSTDLSQDFGFAATTELDIELPFEPLAAMPDETDVLQPLTDDDDYDMSVIIDATKMPQPEDVTERDLKAVELPVDDTLMAQNYTINKEVDYEVLEQDYEDELTATQALNVEIARAAAELEEHIQGRSEDSDDTTALPSATVTELDVTAQMRAQNDDLSDLDDTGVNEALTVQLSTDDNTVEMPTKKGKAG